MRIKDLLNMSCYEAVDWLICNHAEYEIIPTAHDERLIKAMALAMKDNGAEGDYDLIEDDAHEAYDALISAAQESE